MSDQEYQNGEMTTEFDETADAIYGLICCLCFLIGTLGNIFSFLCFKSQQKEISTVIYMLTTANDIVISLAVFPVGIVFLSNRDSGEPGLLFGNEYGRIIWWYAWEISVVLSIFLVTCLSISRTLSLLFPFKRQSLRHLIIAFGIGATCQVAILIGLHNLRETKIVFEKAMARPLLGQTADAEPNSTTWQILDVSTTITYVVPAFVVTISCTISAILLTKGNKRVRRMQSDIQATRNRATVTILLFALVYGICNLPLVIMYILQTRAFYTDDSEWFSKLYEFDKQNYYLSFTFTLLLAANSAANPLLYHWRMPVLREYTISIVRWILRLEKRATKTGSLALREPKQQQQQQQQQQPQQQQHSSRDSPQREGK